MPANPRVRGNNAQGTITNNPLLVGGLSLTSTQLANLPAVATQHALIVLDPLRAAGAPEIVVVTAHTAAATTATITRGAMGTTARQHALGTTWTHAATVDDLVRICTAATRPADPYEGQIIYETDTDSFKGYNTAWEQMLTIGAWTAYTPTLTQLVAVTKTVDYAKYAKVGRTVTAQVRLSATGVGTAANRVTVSLPLTAAGGGAATTMIVGSGWLYDTSASTTYAGPVFMDSATTCTIMVNGVSANPYVGQFGFTAGLASGDLVMVNLTYETTT